MNATLSVIKILLFSLLVIVYPIDSQSTYRLGQNTRSLVIQLSDIQSDALLFREDANNNSNSFCRENFLEPFSIFYDNIFIPFMNEHRVSRFRNLTEEHIDSLKAQFHLTQNTWNSCISHSEEILDLPDLAYQISQDNINFALNRLREHGITGPVLDTLKDIFEFQTVFLLSGNMNCQQATYESYANIAATYNLRSILLINREERVRAIEGSARADFDTVKAEWEACTN